MHIYTSLRAAPIMLCYAVTSFCPAHALNEIAGNPGPRFVTGPEMGRLKCLHLFVGILLVSLNKFPF